MVAIRDPPPKPQAAYDPNLWYLFGVAYDLSPFLSHHPGGLQPLLISRGRDCTNLLRSYHYHPTTHLLHRLRPYRLPLHHDPHGDYTDGIQPDSPFHLALKRLVRSYRRARSLSIRPLHLSVVVLSVLLLVPLLIHYLLHPTYHLAVFLPLLAWLPTSIASHDGSHFATHRNPTFNSLSALLCAPFYFNSTVWIIQHVISHHQYTNDPTRDVDMHHGSLLARMSRAQPSRPWMPYSVIPFLFALQLFCSTLWESLILPVGLCLDVCFGTQRTFPTVPNKNPLVRAHLPQLLGQLTLTLTVLVAPALLHGATLRPREIYLYTFLPFHVSSVIFILSTQFAHLTDRSTRRMARLLAPQPGSNSAAARAAVGFAERQVAASVDVNGGSVWLNLVTGGLNTQSLHHLIPGVHNSHFPLLYAEYRQLCATHDVDLCETGSVVAEFVRYLRDVMAINIRGEGEEEVMAMVGTGGGAKKGAGRVVEGGGEWTVAEVARRQELLVIDGGVYDIGEFARRHPGGRRVISTLGGLDATNIFYSTHRGSVAGLLRIMETLRVGRVTTGAGAGEGEGEGEGEGGVPRATVSAVPRADRFLVELNREVSGVMRGGGLEREAGRAGLVRGLTMVGWGVGWVGMFVLGWGVAAAGWAGLCACALVGQVAHEETHGVLRWGRGRWGGWVVSTVWGMLWPSMSEPYFRFEHTTHHVEPLNPEFDYEVTGLSYFVRYDERQRWRVWHQWQQWYAWGVYGVYILLQTAFEYPLGFFRRFERRYEMGAWHWYNWSVTVVVYGMLPRWVGAVGAWEQAALVFAYAYVWQLTLYLVAAINHAVDGKGEAREDVAGVWSYHVLRHTSNFCVGQPFWSWLSGGFNIQNEHHLLSWIPQEHLHRAVPVTKRLCAKYGYPYHEFESFGALLAAHFRALRAFGTRPEGEGDGKVRM